MVNRSSAAAIKEILDELIHETDVVNSEDLISEASVGGEGTGDLLSVIFFGAQNWCWKYLSILALKNKKSGWPVMAVRIFSFFIWIQFLQKIDGLSDQLLQDVEVDVFCFIDINTGFATGVLA